MTLIVVLGNSDHVVMLSDRRLSANGILVDDESNKAALLRARNARPLVGYTGVATVGYSPGQPRRLPASWHGPAPDPSSGPPPPGAFRTSYWMLDAMIESAPPDHVAPSLIERFAVRASAQFEQLRLSHPNKGVLFCFAGYEYIGGTPKLMLRSVSNFVNRVQSGPDFHVKEAPNGQELPPAFMYAYGMTDALDCIQMQRLGALVSEKRPPQALIGKGVEILSAAADSARAQGVIGKQITSAILPADPSQMVRVDFHSGVVTNTIPGISVVEARGGAHGLGIFADPLIRSGSAGSRANTPAIKVPKVARNAPCPCLSGNKFKHCHGAV